MAHIQKKGCFFLIRVKDSIGIRRGVELPETECFDVDISLKLTRKKTNEIREFTVLCDQGDSTIVQCLQIIMDQQDAVEEQITELQDALDILKYKT